MKIINQSLLDKVSAEAKESSRLRKNYNFHQAIDEKCHRFLNAVEPGTVVKIHRHPAKDETFVLLRGRVVVTIFNDEGEIKESIELCPEEGRYGVCIPKGEWHNLKCIEKDSVFFECKEGPYSPQDQELMDVGR